MNARELRIGNIIDIHVEGADRWLNAHTVTANDIECIELGTTAQGIPLSPEWLERFGFENINELSDGTLVYRGKPYLYFKQGSATFPFKTAEVKYVHQLQNLYFALTGKELELKQ